MEEIHFRYFYDMFQEEFRKKVYIIKQTRIGNNDPEEELDNLFDIYWTNSITEEEKISLYDEVLFEVCANYVSLSNLDINVYPKHSFEFLEMILKERKWSPYTVSFLQSLDFVMQDYFNALKRGDITLRASQDPEIQGKYLQITLDAYNQMIECEAVNMDMTESTETLLRVLKLEKENKIGPVENVVHRFRKDVY